MSETTTTLIQFEDIEPWSSVSSTGDTGLSSRLKLKRNFDKIKLWLNGNPTTVSKAGMASVFTLLDSELNELDINGDLSSLAYIRANVPFFSVGTVSALGIGTSGGGETDGATLEQVWTSLQGDSDDYGATKINENHIPDLSGSYLKLTGGGTLNNGSVARLELWADGSADEDIVFLRSNAAGMDSNGTETWRITYDGDGTLNSLAVGTVELTDNCVYLSSLARLRASGSTIYMETRASASATAWETSDVSDVSNKEDKNNKVTALSSSSTDTEYPSAKCVYDLIGDIETLLAAI